MPEEQVIEKKPEVSAKSPSNPFSGDGMSKWAEQAGIFKEEDKPKVEKKEPEVKAKEEVPCDTCPGGKKEKAQVKEERKPFRTLKVGGKDRIFYSQEEIDKEAMQNVDYTQKTQKLAEKERTISEMERKYQMMAAPLEKLVTMIEQGKMTPLTAVETKTKPEEEETEMEDIHPAIRKRLEAQEQEIKQLKTVANKVQDQEARTQYDQASQVIDTLVKQSKEKYPFDDFVDEESGSNLTQDLYAGYVSVLANRDALLKQKDAGHRVRPLDELIEQGAKDLNRFHLWAKGNGGGPIQTTDSDSLRKVYPKQITEIEQQAVARYLKGQEETPPTLRTTQADTRREEPSKKKLKTFDDYMKAAELDPDIEAGVKESAKSNRATA